MMYIPWFGGRGRSVEAKEKKKVSVEFRLGGGKKVRKEEKTDDHRWGKGGTTSGPKWMETWRPQRLWGRRRDHDGVKKREKKKRKKEKSGR